MNKTLENKMNLYLANQLVNFVKLHDMHWNLKGRSFFTVHEKLEELYNQSAEIIDDVAERILALGGTPIATIKEAAEVATIKEMPAKGPKSDTDVIVELVSDTKWWIEASKELVALAEAESDGATADMFNDYVKEYQKLAWMLDAYLA